MDKQKIQELIKTVEVFDGDWVRPTASYLNNPDNFPFERCRVRKGNKRGFIKPNGTYLLVNGKERPFDDAGRFSEGFARVRIGGKYGFINTDGQYLLVNGEERPFDYAYRFSERFAWVKIGSSDEFLLSKHGLLLPNDNIQAKRLERLILNEFPVGSMKFYIFLKLSQ